MKRPVVTCGFSGILSTFGELGVSGALAPGQQRGCACAAGLGGLTQKIRGTTPYKKQTQTDHSPHGLSNVQVNKMITHHTSNIHVYSRNSSHTHA